MTLTTQPLNAALDLTAGYGQRSESFRFALVNGTTGGPLGDLHPLRAGSLTHDTGRTTKRNLTLTLGVADTAAINPVTDRLDVFCVINGVEYPLGRYMFTNLSTQRFTAGRLGSLVLMDEMFVIDQEIDIGFNTRGRSVVYSLQQMLADFSFDREIESSSYTVAEVWTVGTRRGQILNTLALTGDYFSPWFDNQGRLRFIRIFDPAVKVPDFDFDAGSQVQLTGVVETNDLLTAPNRFVVISNAQTDTVAAVYGTADVPMSAPHSIQNRGFVITQTFDLQVTSSIQARSVARSYAIRNSVLEYVNLSTALDPRHDSYDVVYWDDQLWLETAWSMDLVPGGKMTHTLQKVYS